MKSVVFLAHTPAGGPFAIGSHFLADAMARSGLVVTHIAPPVAPLHLLRVRDAATRARLARAVGVTAPRTTFTDILPVGLLPAEVALRFPPLASFYRRARLPRRARRIAADLAIFDHPLQQPMLRDVEASIVIYRPTDLYAQMSGPWVQPAEDDLLARCDGVVATSSEVARHIRQRRFNGHLIVVPNGIGPVPFSNRGDERVARREVSRLRALAASRPCVIYVGAIDERFDIEAVLCALDALPQLFFAFVGPVARLARRRLTRDNSVVLGARAPLVARAVMEIASVGLIPLSGHGANLGRSPIKALEYLGSGARVVARRTPALESLASEFDHDVFLYDTTAELVDRVADAIGSTRQPPQLPKHLSWSAKAAEILSFAESLRSA